MGAAADWLDLKLRTKTPTLKKQVLKRRLELETMGEELRILYVAMTRAKEELIMTGTDRSLSSKLERWRTGRTEEKTASIHSFIRSRFLSGLDSYGSRCSAAGTF